MKIDLETVRRIAYLARLEFSEAEEQEMIKSLSEILDWMEKLREVDTDGVEPLTHMSDRENALREDVAELTLSHKDALENAPAKDSDYFRVPKFME